MVALRTIIVFFVSVLALSGCGNGDAFTLREDVLSSTSPESEPVTISAKPAAQTNGSSFTVVFNMNSSTNPQAPLGFVCSINGAPPSSCTSPHLISFLDERSYVLSITPVFASGKPGKPRSVTWTVDRSVSVPVFAQAPTGRVRLALASFFFELSSNLEPVTFECNFNNTTWQNCSAVTTHMNTSGAQTVSVRAKDQVGNISSPVTRNWYYDNEPPTIQIISAPNANVNQTNTSVNWYSPENSGADPVTFTCSLNGSPYQSCSPSDNFIAVAQQLNLLKVRATDSAGNQSSDSTLSWFVDTVLPTASITSGPSTTTSATTASFIFTGADTSPGSIARFECSLDGTSFSTCVSPKNYTSLTNGSRQFRVRSIDSAGNLSAVATHSWTIGSASESSYDYLVNNMTELNNVLALSVGVVSGKTIALAPGNWPKILLSGKRYTSYVKFTSANPANKAKVSSIQIQNCDYIDIDGLEVFHSLWPANPETGFSRELIYLTNTNNNIRIQNNYIHHGYGNTSWTGWPMGHTGVIEFDETVGTYPEFGYRVSHVYGPNDGQYYGFVPRPQFSSPNINSTPMTIDTINGLTWDVPVANAGGVIRLINEGTSQLFYEFGNETTVFQSGSVNGKASLSTSLRPLHLALYITPTSTAQRNRLRLWTNTGETTRAIVRTEIGIAGWLAQAIGGVGARGTFEISNNTISDVANAIKFMPSAESETKIIGNVIERVYMDYISIGVGNIPPKLTEIAWNIGTKPFVQAGIFLEKGHPADPHADFIQFFGDDLGTTPGVDMTGQDWKNIRLVGNRFYNGTGIGSVQGLFTDDMPTQLGFNYKNVYIVGNIIGSSNMPHGITIRLEDGYAFRNNSLRQDPNSPQNVGEGSGAANLTFINQDGSYAFASSNLVEGLVTGSNTELSNNLILGKNGKLDSENLSAPSNYLDHFVGNFNTTVSDLTSFMSRFSIKPSSVAFAQQIGAINASYIDYDSRTVDVSQEPPAWNFVETMNAQASSLVESNLSVFMGGPISQTVTLPAGVEGRVFSDDTGTTPVSMWLSHQITISPFQYFKLRTVAAATNATTTEYAISCRGTQKKWKITTASPPFSKVEFLGDFMRTTSGLMGVANLNAEKVLIAFRIEPKAYTSGDFLIHSSNRLSLRIATGGELRVSVNGTRNANFPSAIPSNQASTIYISVDSAAASAEEGIKVYRESNQIAPSQASLSWTTPTSANLNWGDSAAIWTIMGSSASSLSTSPVSQATEAHLEFMYLAVGSAAIDQTTGQLADISTSVVRNRFTRDLIGANGNGVTGQPPQLFILGSASAFNSNSGLNLGTGKKVFMDSIDGGVTDVP